MSTRMAATAAQMHAPEVDDPTKRPLPSIEEIQGWSRLGQVELIARITDLLDHAEDYQRLVDPLSWRQGLEDVVVAVVAAMDPTKEEREAGADGVGAVWIYEFCEAFGLDGIRVIERVAAATREAAED